MLGDIVMSVETAARQAEEQGHELLDEIRILLVCVLTCLCSFTLLDKFLFLGWVGGPLVGIVLDLCRMRCYVSD